MLGPTAVCPVLGNDAQIAAIECMLISTSAADPTPSVRLAGPLPETRRLTGIQICLSEAERNGGGARVES